MSVKTITDILVVNSGIAAYVADRITPINRTQDMSLPAITLNLISTDPTIALSGDTGFDHEKIQVDTWSFTYKEAHDIAVLVRKAIEAAGYMIAMQMDDFDENAELSGVFRVMQEYDVWTQS